MTAGCDEHRESISALIDGALDPAQAAAVEAHLAGCAACAAERDALAALSAQVQALPRIEVPGHFLAGVMAGVVEAQATSDRPGGAATPAAGAPVDCEAMAEDVSALLDRQLRGEALARVQTHLVDCATCQAERAALQRVRDKVGGLPRLEVPQGFTSQVLARVAEVEREAEEQALQRVRAARDARQRWWGTLGNLAQAAALLLVVGGGMALTSPDDPSLPMLQRGLAYADSPAPRAVRREAPAKPAVPPPLPRGDADWELRVSDLESGRATARRLLDSWGRTLQERRTEGSVSFYVDLPRANFDDLAEGLDAASGVQTNQEVVATLADQHVEQDQVVLKNGFVLVGRLLEQDRSGVKLEAGGARHEIPARNVERVERASERRKLRVVLHPDD
jgi:anti-sigma factor RsiW